MTERKWTPGPWMVETGDDGVLSSVFRYEDVEYTGIAYLTLDNHEANARLIAAAPDLYEALDAIIDGISWSMSDNKFGAAKSALAKARGE
jgi:hypothetical protein